MATLSLFLFGQFQARLDDQPISSFQTRKVQALLIYLAAEPGKHLRESLMDLMWPGMPVRSARHNLRQVLYYLRSAIPELQSSQDEDQSQVPTLLANRQMIQLNPEASVKVDAAHFESLLNGVLIHEHINVLTCQTCHGDLEKATDIYQGDFLVDFYLDDSNAYEDWAQMTREAYRRKVLDALELLTAAATRQGEYSKAQALAKRQLEIDNLRENAYRQLMEALALSGHREEALAVYDNCRRLLAEELGMEPTTRTTEIAEKIQTGDLSFDTPLAQGVRGYELREEIGVGAYGQIHRAYQSAIDREVAVKVIRRRYANDPEFIRRFEDEAHTVARLEHPHIVPLYDYWRDPDGAYLVMRFLRGGSLLSALETNPWGVEPASQMLDQVASALSAAHRQGVIHRDIKPANILLDETGNAYLSDFGIAKELGGNRGLTEAGAVLGTPDYISPEQILNEQVGPQSDIYSLGAVLFETLTGEKPFGYSSMANLIYKQLNDPFPLVSASRPGLPPQIDSVIQKATAKQAADRYQDALEMAEAFRHAWAGSTVTETGSVPAAILAGDELYNPYKGLQAFQEADTDDFFGRNALIDQLIKHLTPTQTLPLQGGGIKGGGGGRFLALVGPSGSGKSSAIKAGLLPALRSGAVPDSEKWFFAEMVPGTHPLEELEMALWPVAVDAPPSLVEPMQRDVRGMLRTIRRTLPEASDGRGAQLLLVIDQFEELFTLVEDEARRNFFLDSLLVAISAPRSPLRVVVTLRADFYDRPLQLQALGSLLKEGTEIVLPMTPEELTWAVREPARRVGVGLEEGLAEVIVADVVDQPGSLPLMQYALTELFERRQDNQMTRDDYQEIGGVMGALGRHAEELYGVLNGDEREAARQLFLRLVTLGEGVEDTRRRVLRSELEAIANGKQPTINNLQKTENGKLLTIHSSQFTIHKRAIGMHAALSHSPLSTVIDAFGAARLLTFDHDPATRGATVEVAHEALLREWMRLRSWLDESRDDVRLGQKLARAAGEWLAAGQDESFLLRGSRLSTFESWADDSQWALTEEEQAYLHSSIALREKRAANAVEQQEHEARLEQRANRRLKALVAVMAVALFVAVVLVVAALAFARQAEEQRLLATARRLASAAVTNLGLDPERSVLLALEAAETTYSVDGTVLPEVEDVLRQAVQADRVRLTIPMAGALAYSPDGEMLAIGGEDGQLALWDTATGQQIRNLAGHQDSISAIAFSKGGWFIVTSSFDSTVNFWDTDSGRLIGTIQGAESVNGFAISRDATQLATRDNDTIKLWDIDSITEGLSEESKLVQLREPTLEIETPRASSGVAFDTDGSRLAAIIPELSVFIWDTRTGEQLLEIPGAGDSSGIAFNSSGRRLAAGSGDAGVTIWDATTGKEIRSFHEPSPIADVHFSQDFFRRFLVTGAKDGTAALWDELTGRQLIRIPARSDGFNFIALRFDDRQMATGSDDGRTRIWDLSPLAGGEILAIAAHEGEVYDAVYGPDGAKIASTGDDGAIKLWDSATGEQLLSLPGRTDFVFFPAFSPDGRRLAAANREGGVSIWDADSGQELLALRGNAQAYTAVTFSPDGSRLAAAAGLAGGASDVNIWDAATGENLVAFRNDSEITRLVYDLGGGRIWSYDWAGFATSWDAVTGDEFPADPESATLRVCVTALWDAELTQDGLLWAAAGFDGLAHVYRADGDPEDEPSYSSAFHLVGHTADVTGTAFNADGSVLASSSFDGTVKLWDMSDGRELLTLTSQPHSLGGVDFSPDGRTLATAGADGMIRFFIMSAESIDELMATARSGLSRDLTHEECARYLHTPICKEA